MEREGSSSMRGQELTGGPSFLVYGGGKGLFSSTISLAGFFGVKKK